MSQLVECIPNFSEARRPEIVDDLIGAIGSVEGARLLDRSSDLDHNRTVLTFAGTPEAVEEAAFRAIKAAGELIDLDQHTGEHPRIGATDVVPFVPLSGVTMEDCIAIARRLGERVGRELQIPVYLYEYAATRPERANLENLRRGQYEGLKVQIETDPTRKPDFGPSHLGKAGATVIGARNPLIAFNAYLTTADADIAKRIAKAIRQSSGGFRYVKALGLLVEGRAQVSMNLTNYRESPIGRVVEGEGVVDLPADPRLLVVRGDHDRQQGPAVVGATGAAVGASHHEADTLPCLEEARPERQEQPVPDVRIRDEGEAEDQQDLHGPTHSNRHAIARYRARARSTRRRWVNQFLAGVSGVPPCGTARDCPAGAPPRGGRRSGCSPRQASQATTSTTTRATAATTAHRTAGVTPRPVLGTAPFIGGVRGPCCGGSPEGKGIFRIGRPSGVNFCSSAPPARGPPGIGTAPAAPIGLPRGAGRDTESNECARAPPSRTTSSRRGCGCSTGGKADSGSGEGSAGASFAARSGGAGCEACEGYALKTNWHLLHWTGAPCAGRSFSSSSYSVEHLSHRISTRLSPSGAEDSSTSTACRLMRDRNEGPHPVHPGRADSTHPEEVVDRVEGPPGGAIADDLDGQPRGDPRDHGQVLGGGVLVLDVELHHLELPLVAGGGVVDLG